jgi:pimeloyl-ACP methyl ester carboxylesterase
VKQVLARKAVARQGRYRRIFGQLSEQLEGGFALEKVVAETDVPVLVIWGEEDRLLHVSGARVLAEAAPDRVRVERMPNVGHAPMLERPAESAAAFRAFAADLP